jgi:hypothetical protein
MTYTFIAGRCGDLPVAVCCRVMKVSTSGFYAWRAQPCSDRDWDDALLTNTIVEIHRMSRRSYGSPRVLVEPEVASRIELPATTVTADNVDQFVDLGF